jgi:hypothetical protein
MTLSSSEHIYVCPECNNTGYIRDICNNCNGSGEGYYDGSTCFICHGWGVCYMSCPLNCDSSKENWND